jgi:hypothetical protein
MKLNFTNFVKNGSSYKKLVYDMKQISLRPTYFLLKIFQKDEYLTKYKEGKFILSDSLSP